MSLEPQSDAARKLEIAADRVRTHLPPHLPPVWVLTDPNRTPDPCRLAECIPQGWGVIYRHFGADDHRSIAHRLKAISAKRQLKLLIAADPETASDCKADGVHWPERLVDGRLPEMRKFAINTVSCHDPNFLKTYAEIGFDAALVSTVFPSRSASAGQPIGPANLKHIAQSCGLPVYGLGGLNAENALEIADFAGLAMIEGAHSALCPKT